VYLFSYYFSKRAKSGDKGGLQDLPDVGHVCCGKYTFDQVWYRALVTAVSFENNQVTVLYVDEGISETLPLSGLRELDEKFTSLPRQALRVQLRDLELSNDISPDEGKHDGQVLLTT
jgi:tudor domain-containing protein 1/4/6/7